MPYLKNNTLYINDLGKTKEFDTKVSNKSGLFSKIKEKTSELKAIGEIRYIQERVGSKTTKGKDDTIKITEFGKADSN